MTRATFATFCDIVRQCYVTFIQPSVYTRKTMWQELHSKPSIHSADITHFQGLNRSETEKPGDN